MRTVCVLLLCVFFSVFACDSNKVNPDGASPDSGVQDQGSQDSVTPDNGNADTGVADKGAPDTGVADKGQPDTAKSDATPDTSVADNAPKDTGSPDTATSDNATSDTSPPTDKVDDKSMSFFITSVGVGDGANLGGLAGADAHCKKLADDAGVTGKTWRAYLSSSTGNAKDRIGTGPWYNAKGVMIAKDVADLHSANNNLNKQTALDEKGNVVNGRGDTPNRHDILTGSKADGTLNPDKTCADWTSNSTGSATLGHHDRQGGGADPTSWNSAHDSRSCSQADLVATGGAGLFYCFAP